VSHDWKNLARELCPPLVLSGARRLRQRLTPGTGYVGDHPSWDAARAASTGYDADLILERTKAATLEVKEGRAAYERDTMLFERPQYAWPVLSSLFWIAARTGELSVLDFGGALGSTYFNHRRFLQTLPGLRWSVVEQPHVARCGTEHFAEPSLNFFSTIEECFAAEKPNVALFSGVVQYLPKPFEVIEAVAVHGVPTLIVDMTPFQEQGRDVLTVQNVPPQIYPASYPCWLFDEAKFRDFCARRWPLVTDFDSSVPHEFTTNLGLRARYRGLLFSSLVG
jgi:putative methyltransferase (TIGR04325 family)